jgi:hypothetical protein
MIPLLVASNPQHRRRLFRLDRKVVIPFVHQRPVAIMVLHFMQKMRMKQRRTPVRECNDHAIARAHSRSDTDIWCLLLHTSVTQSSVNSRLLFRLTFFSTAHNTGAQPVVPFVVRVAHQRPYRLRGRRFGFCWFTLTDDIPAQAPRSSARPHRSCPAASLLRPPAALP